MAFYNLISDGNNFVISFTQNPQQDFGVFAKGYTRAASVLAEHLLEKPRFSDYEAYPVVFLYRQAFELYLKGLYFKASLIFFFKDSQKVDCQFIYKHRLQPLADTFQKICKALFPSDQALLQIAQKVLTYRKFCATRGRIIQIGAKSQLLNKGKGSWKAHSLLTCRDVPAKTL
jgi:hypothetical protein